MVLVMIAIPRMPLAPPDRQNKLVMNTYDSPITKRRRCGGAYMLTFHHVNRWPPPDSAKLKIAATR